MSYQIKMLSQLCDIVIGRTPARKEPAYWGKGNKWVSISDLTAKVICDTKEEITDYAIKHARCRKVPKGTLLFSFKLTIGKMAFAGCDLYTNEAIAALHIKDKKELYSEYLFFALQTVKFLGSNQAVMGKTLNSQSLAEIEIPLPPLDDQKRIAHLLGSVEALIARRKQHLQQLDDLLKSVFLEMFGFVDKTYSKWIIDSLSKHTEVVSGVTKGKKYKSNHLIDVPYMRVANVQDGYFVLDEIKTIFITQKEFDLYQLLAGDILLTEGGDPDKLGRGAVWQNQIENCIHQNHIFRVRVNDKSRINPEYLSALIGSPYGKSYFFRSAKQTTGIASINSTQLKKFPLVIPPIHLQNQFAAIVEKVESIKFCYQKSLADLEALYGALSQKAFKGELDLSSVPLPGDDAVGMKREPSKPAKPPYPLENEWSFDGNREQLLMVAEATND